MIEIAKKLTENQFILLSVLFTTIAHSMGMSMIGIILMTVGNLFGINRVGYMQETLIFNTTHLMSIAFCVSVTMLSLNMLYSLNQNEFLKMNNVTEHGKKRIIAFVPITFCMMVTHFLNVFTGDLPILTILTIMALSLSIFLWVKAVYVHKGMNL